LFEELKLSLSDLDEKERDVVRECLRAAVEGPFFPEWEFHAIFGLEREEVEQILSAWPKLDESDNSVVTAINNCFNNLLGYPAENKDGIWPNFISVGQIEVARIFDKWQRKPRRSFHEARDYFDDLM